MVVIGLKGKKMRIDEDEKFRIWWRQEGSEMLLNKSVFKIAEIAWSNGRYVEKESWESRTCENCKYSTNDNWVCDAGIGRPSKDFGCNKFEEKKK